MHRTSREFRSGCMALQCGASPLTAAARS
ncbi:similar to mannosidase, beta A, lysosomal-like, isoform CRA_b [Rattus norvegicus]|uniref:Similar to mannosidase, beta A, lysosomal-like, isoform CRA_b n=1 Tax=Rattus norvegicus TaxID=10116 RepID=A6JWS6_RAT|nr:similar to mannosidase, beta A, lysosomal-like, isoform CRA_b [Rattus norvegicus]